MSRMPKRSRPLEAEQPIANPLETCIFPRFSREVGTEVRMGEFFSSPKTHHPLLYSPGCAYGGIGRHATLRW